MIGQTLGHYRIEAKLGAGGMGEVYRAEDLQLDRRVALKVLPAELAENPERLDRFEREAKTLAALDHPNIVTIYSVEEIEGLRFLTMQLVEGRPLSELIPRDGMPLSRLFETAIPLADALASAHERGIVHRDLKPANVMVTDRGQVKVLDFGLAKLLAGPGTVPMSTAMPTEPLTEEGRIVGTVPYMSPEQLEGGELDARSDIFSLGVVLYEMATGARPFRGESPVSLMSSIVKDVPEPVDSLRAGLPHHLGRIVSRCLEKDPERRYQTAKDVRNELDALAEETSSDTTTGPSSATIARPARSRRYRWWMVAVSLLIAVLALGLLWLWRRESPVEHDAGAAASVSQGPMIAVLPFENLGPPEDQYFADGMTEEITSRLAAVSGLGVISRTSAMQYKENRPPLKQIGEELGVQYILEGTVRWAKAPDGTGRVRITPQLIRVADDRHLWADNLERTLDDIFAVQAQIAAQVVSELGVTLLASEKTALASRPTASLAAYEAYLRGLDSMKDREHKEAARLFELAVAEDPGFVAAQSQLVVTYARLHGWGDFSADWASKSAAALETAQALAADDLAVRLATAVYEYYIPENFERALTIVKQLVEAHPNDTELLQYVGYISRRLGRWEESNTALEQALRRDPRDTDTLSGLGANYGDLLRYEEAEVMLDRCIEVAPGHSGCYRLKAWNRLFWTGDTAAARRIAVSGPEHFWNDFLLARLDSLDRDFTSAMERLDKLGASTSGELFGQRIRVTIPYAIGERARAAEAARALVPMFEELIAKQPRDFVDLSVLGMLYAVLGRRELALTTGERAMELGRHDRFQVGFTWSMMAETCLILGEDERAIELVDRVLATPGWDRPSHYWYRLDPLWDPLREDPRFQAILDQHTPG